LQIWPRIGCQQASIGHGVPKEKWAVVDIISLVATDASFEQVELLEQQHSSLPSTF
jgi:hypothetical protein